MTTPPHHRTRIKICGVRDVATALHAAACGADAIGLMRVEQSPRFIDESLALEIARALPSFVEPVWVFRNQEIPTPPPGTMQLHGDEDAAFVAALRERMPRPQRIIRAIAFDDAQVHTWDSNPDIDALLVEVAEPGEGAGFDHTRLAAIRDALDKPLIIAGGLGPENVSAAIEAIRPYAVDVSSGVESLRGEKDLALIEQFCASIRAADTQCNG